MRWTLPNILTVARLIAAPLVPVMFLYFARPWADWYAMILFIVASITDYLDGYLARAWKLESLFGAAMDPIADKAMVLIALLVINGYAGMTPWILLPSALIIYREVFVSGLRETLGDKARALKVTNLAKWKTTVQMVAIAVLFSTGIFEHSLLERTIGMDDAIVAEIFAGTFPDDLGLNFYATGLVWSTYIGVSLLWIAGILTMITGWDYFRKALPFLREEPENG
ncbi:CDP-diacylglycerol--glycerol-3-phosphate 3-phosphatidyltransferase [Aliiroseovarius crassostreae]|uniref:CDP-diacylglycerol--glycerol-3-phosphate 3-phosphatidyltransferase n=1 Tax=Aliiroseovarius crassostreae TaxID=154981 RepID=A0A0N8IBV1_9RHOB|nr:CDP-diacylglycerol--glycerol-3-phosphate 3-phosphatidyltransferase [Aliiroseovarius crassostreae]KPN64131.1 CDP-diacylglycerol--glycerol-3-phosphate 3-phosphatidyltransferase [Aliiroseovarius crassostreae]SFU28732.1 CDP-diacylglycerol--glycerol-3-phosphate 3-phosphatidyltransferase [Aliiroseovarius crassostreae]